MASATAPAHPLQVFKQPPTRSQINRLQSELQQMPQADVPTEHDFGPGFYARTIRLKAGTLLVGKTHATQHIFILSEGELALATEGGNATIKAPFQIVSPPGVKRVGLALTDVVCTNIHITNETDLDRLEAELIQPEAIAAPAATEELAWLG